MQKFNDLKRGPNSSPVANSSADGKMTSFNVSGQRSLDSVGGEPLAGSGFENEEPESDFAPAGEER
jgi:hypothetical protein